VYTIQACLPHFRDRKSGLIINVSSIGGRIAAPFTDIDYSASLTIRDVAKELASQNVTFIISGLPPETSRQFERDGLTKLIGADRFFNHLEEALAVFHREPTI
jgi:MFS superfamily sulfate permease-like transporter